LGGVPRRQQRRSVVWLGVTTTAPISIAAGVATVTTVVPNTSLVEFEGGGTVVRTRGIWRMEALAADGDPVLEMGLAVVDERARAAGAGSVPLPADLEDLFWFTVLHAGALVETRFADALVDAKSMRKFDASDAIVLVAQEKSGVHSAVLRGYTDCLLMRGSSS